jgi:hypothetical protein
LSGGEPAFISVGLGFGGGRRVFFTAVFLVSMAQY